MHVGVCVGVWGRQQEQRQAAPLSTAISNCSLLCTLLASLVGIKYVTLGSVGKEPVPRSITSCILTQSASSFSPSLARSCAALNHCNRSRSSGELPSATLSIICKK